MILFASNVFEPNGFGPDFGPPWWFQLVAGIIICFVLYAIIRGFVTWSANNAAPILTVPAILISKRTSTSGGAGDTSVSTFYYLTFEYENGERAEFRVQGQEYGMLVEGDTGLLTYQGTRYKGFQRRR